MISKLKGILNSVLTKLKNRHILFLIGNAAMTILNMLQVVILLRYLPINVMGIWFFFQSTLALVDTFRAGLLTTAFVTSYAGTSEERSAEVAGSAWYLSIMITLGFVILSGISFLIPYKIDNEGMALFTKWFGLVFIITLPSFIASCVLQAEQKFDRLLYIRFISQILSIVFVLILIATNTINLNNVVYTSMLAGALTSLATIFFGWARIGTLKHKTYKCVNDLFQFGKYSVATSFGSNLFRYSDTFIINLMLGPAAIAVYNIGLKLMEIVEFPLRSLVATVMPSLSAAHNQENKYHVIFLLKKYSGMLTYLLIPVAIGALFFADFGIKIIAEKYSNTEAANVLRLFMTFALLYPAERFMALTIDAINQPRINMIKLFIMLAINIIADFAGIYFFHNVLGVALATLLPTLAGIILGYIVIKRYYAFSFWDIYRVGYLELQTLIKEWLGKNKKAIA